MNQSQEIMQSYTTFDTSCHLLNVPPELRNAIYQHIFDCTTNSEVELRTATPPSKSLVLTCRDVHNETARMYRTFYRRYWTTTPFIIAGDYPALSLNGDEILSLDPEALEHVTCLKISCLCNQDLVGTWRWYVSATFTLMDQGHWTWERKLGSENNLRTLAACQYIRTVPREGGDATWPLYQPQDEIAGWGWYSRWHKEDMYAVQGEMVGMKEQILALMRAVRRSIAVWKEINGHSRRRGGGER